MRSLRPPSVCRPRPRCACIIHAAKCVSPGSVKTEINDITGHGDGDDRATCSNNAEELTRRNKLLSSILTCISGRLAVRKVNLIVSLWCYNPKTPCFPCFSPNFIADFLKVPNIPSFSPNLFCSVLQISQFHPHLRFVK